MNRIAYVCIMLALASCQMPPLSEVVKNGVDCKADITTPSGVDSRPQPGEIVTVKVKIYDCKDVP